VNSAGLSETAVTLINGRLLVWADADTGLALCRDLAALLGNCGLELVTDRNLIESSLARYPADVLLIDTDGLGDGLEPALQRIRGIYPAEALTIVLVGNPGTVDCDALLSLGATDCLYKPVSRAELGLRLANILSSLNRLKAEQTARQDLEREIQARTAKLNLLIDSGLMMGMERSRAKLLQHILREGQKLLHCDGATMYWVTPQGNLKFAERTRTDCLPVNELPLYRADSGSPNDNYVAIYAAVHNKPVIIDDVYRETRFDCSGTRDFDTQSGYRTVSLLTVPMAPRNGAVIGVLQFINALDPGSGAVIPFPVDVVELVEALAAQAAVALDNLQLIQSQKDTTESIIQVLAAALDTKSPHTGHHCVRVPDLAIMLAKAACRESSGPLADFDFSNEDQWLEFRVGAWLHDCGKVTTPEYVIEKATKLDMLYNRIHEVRMRFEVLLRDAQIERLENLANGMPSGDADDSYRKRKTQLFDDFAFIAECNKGQESMQDADCDRIRAIAANSWLRYFDDTLGLSEDEDQRLRGKPKPPLPVSERLLADKTAHIVPRAAWQTPDPALEIKMQVPENLFNYGEIYNLTIQKGTLTAEDRYKINEHIIETIKLLEKIPFPDFLKRVPEYASTHHETLDGKGYPRKLTERQLSIPARIMAIADIFEAITASDRPYKRPYKLSQALKIMCDMKNNRHIDATLFELFLTSGVYLEFARKYLYPEQIDAVDIGQFLSSPVESVCGAGPSDR